MDVVVIGAGVVGAGIALELAKSGRDVLVLDKGGGAGLGSTSASSAIVRFHYSTFEGVAVAWEAKFRWEEWPDYLGTTDPAGLARYTRTGVLAFQFPGLDFERLTAHYDQIGVPYEWLTGPALQRAFPDLDTGRYYPPRRLDDDSFWDDPAGEVTALWTPDGGFVDDPPLAAHNLLHAAMARGARARFHARVRGVEVEGGAVRSVTLASGERVPARAVVNAAGPHSGEINALAGATADFSISTRPLRQEVHRVLGPARPGGTIPVVNDGDLGTYFRRDASGGILVGSQEPPCDPLIWIEDPDRHDARASAAAYEAQSTRLARRVPGARIPQAAAGIAGIYDVSSDWIPVYDRTGIDGYYVAIGTSGNQFKNAPVIGGMVTAIIDACEAGHDHDARPVTWLAAHAGVAVSLGHYSRLRTRNPHSSNSVLG
ncbi:MAG TPA: FAD-dependent oxidoreductase [Streptosporangiaceae bacterium]|nr:FAD-dependent oxidoreductase [Streptosporangiaceae bacterium]